MNLQNHYVDMMVYGYVDKKTWEDIRRPAPQPELQVEESETDDDDDGEGDWETSSESDEEFGSGKGREEVGTRKGKEKERMRKGKGRERAALFDDDTEDEEGDGVRDGEADEMDVDVYAMNTANGDQGSILSEIQE